MNEQTDYLKIHDIIRPFHTRLQNNKKIFCQNILRNNINITSSVLFDSVYVNSSNIYEFFASGQGFEFRANDRLSFTYYHELVPRADYHELVTNDNVHAITGVKIISESFSFILWKKFVFARRSRVSVFENSEQLIWKS